MEGRVSSGSYYTNSGLKYYFIRLSDERNAEKGLKEKRTARTPGCNRQGEEVEPGKEQLETDG